MNCRFVILGVCAIVVSCVRSHTLAQDSDDKTAPDLQKIPTTAQNDKLFGKRMEKLETKISLDHVKANYSSSTVNSTSSSSTISQTDGFLHAFNATGPMWFDSIESGALQRTGLVVLGVMSLLVMLFVVRAVRIRQRRSKSRKYGVITSAASDMEMEPLERAVDDDEEETTLFDAQQKFRSK